MDTILVTGVGGGVGQSILKSLQGSEYRVVATDPDHLAVGLHATPTAYLGPRADAASFLEDLVDICTREQCTLLFPGIEPELLPIAVHEQRLREAGVVPVVSAPEVICTCDDKLATAEFLTDHGFAAPATEPLTDDIDSTWFPCVLKPQRGGARSERTFVVTDKASLDVARALVDPSNCVVQEFIDGDEYTCGTVTLDGVCHGVIVMRRTLRAGDTYKAFVVRDPEIESYVKAVAEALGPFGACNFQLRRKNGQPCIFEINARCSGMTFARAQAGFNEPQMIADHVLRGVSPRYEIREITVLRYWKELVVENDRLTELLRTRVQRGDGQLL
jgi:carbamoyl-phosphate synthase large subunit